MYETIEEEIKTYDLIIKARVEKIDTVYYIDEALLNHKYATRDSGSYFTNILVSLNVQSIFKGSRVNSTIKIMTGVGGGDCGYYFNVGKNYVIYARKRGYILIDSFDETKASFKSHDEDFFETDDCTRTTESVSKEELILRKILQK